MLVLKKAFSKNHSEKLRAGWISVIAASFLIVMKLVVGILTNSLAILSDAAHSTLDLVGALITLFAVKVSDKPPDKAHNYGHAKIEGLSAMAEVFLLIGFCAFIFYSAIQRLTGPDVHVDVNIYAFGATILSIIIHGSRSFFLYRTAKKTCSQALEANALHFLSDMWSSIVVLIGLVAYRYFSYIHADTIAAILVAVSVLFMTIKLAKKVLSVLMDKAPLDIVSSIDKIVRSEKGVKKLLKLRVRTSGVTVFTDMIITVSPSLSVDQAHCLSDKIEKNIRSFYPNSDITIHIEPEKANN